MSDQTRKGLTVRCKTNPLVPCPPSPSAIGLKFFGLKFFELILLALGRQTVRSLRSLRFLRCRNSRGGSERLGAATGRISLPHGLTSPAEFGNRSYPLRALHLLSHQHDKRSAPAPGNPAAIDNILSEAPRRVRSTVDLRILAATRSGNIAHRSACWAH